MPDVKITYLGHACFCLEAEGYRTVLDPYEDNNVPGMPPLRVEAEAVFCSHGHGDHNAVHNVHLVPAPKAAPYTLTTLKTPHDHHEGTKRGMNLIHILNFDGIRVAHLGDLGRPLTEAEQTALQGVDCLLAPVGGFFTVCAAETAEICKQIQPRVMIPMHFRGESGGYPVIAPVSDFLALCGSHQTCGKTFTLTKDTEKQVLVMDPNN